MTEIDLHGHNFEEAKAAVLKFIDTLYYNGEAQGRIIHGHGIIADNLAKWLKEYPHVLSTELDFFNRGSTIVRLDQS